MYRKSIGPISLLALALGFSTVACTPDGGHVASASAQPDKTERVAARNAAKAHEELGRNRADAAVALAERAVAIEPRQTDYRLLLGQSYLAAGRFASAETAFHDTLAISPNETHARFDLAMAQTARGRGAEALPALHALAGSGVPVADLGLAIVMAGDHQGGIRMLIDAARSPQSNVHVRQNLALAFALDGRWREARALAMQDTPPDRIDDQIARWAALAAPQKAQQTVQVAAMLGVQPAKDPGQPTELALDTTTPVDPAKPPVALAAAGAAPVPVQAATPAPAAVAMPLRPPAPVAVAANAPQTVQGAETISRDKPLPPVLSEAAPESPVLLAAAPAKPVAPAALLRAHARAASLPEPVAKGEWAVQLGAFARGGAVDAAWSRASAGAPSLVNYTPARGHVSLSGTIFTRLSVTGFATYRQAEAMCAHVHSRGGSCFVRRAEGDAPLRWARRSTGLQLASR